MLRKKVKKVTGTDRINKVVDTFKTQLEELELGMAEITTAMESNNNLVSVAEEKLVSLKERVHNKNATLGASAEIATTLAENLGKLLGVE